MKNKFYFLIVLTIMLITGCAGPLKHQTYEDQALSDPLEGFNRASYAFNNSIDKALLKPLATGYKKTLPKPAQKGISNFFNNATEPLNFINNLLQLKLNDSLSSLTRFAFNSTLGLGGLIDITGEMGLEEQPEDFGQTLAYWGVKPGPYIMVPLLGPSNVRDFLGDVPDRLLSVSNVPDSSNSKLAITTLDIVDTRSGLLSLDALLEKQIDPYTFIKSGYEQNRMGQVFDGEPPESDENF